MTRSQHRKKSNNPENRAQNLCALSVAKYLGVNGLVTYLHTMPDLVRATRKAYTVRSRKSSVRANTVGKARKTLANLDGRYYMVRVKDHVLLLDTNGNTLIDTDPRKRDKRKITHLYAVI